MSKISSWLRKNLFIAFYVAICVCVFCTTAIVTNVIAAAEFGEHYWEFASAYAPFFLFQCTFLPLTLALLYRPLRTYIAIWYGEVDWKRPTDTFRTIWPVAVLPFVLSLACYLEFFDETVAIWEISPASVTLEEAYSYDKDKYLEENWFEKVDSHEEVHWKVSQVWPNKYYYLRAMSDFKSIAESIGIDQANRQLIASAVSDDQRSFKKFVSYESIKAGLASNSLTRKWYFVSFTVLFGIAIFSVTLSIYFSVLHIGLSIRKNTFRPELLALSLSLLCWMIWLPMRAVTIEIKSELYGSGIDDNRDFLIMVLLMISVGFLALPWFAKYREYIVGAMTLGGSFLSIFVALQFPNSIAPALNQFGFYLGFSVIIWLVVLGFWSYQANKGFNPANLDRHR